jgi:hypothetical protein
MVVSVCVVYVDMYACVCVCMYIYIYALKYPPLSHLCACRTYIWRVVHMYACIHYIHIYMHKVAPTMVVSVRVVHMDMYACACIYIYIYIYIKCAKVPPTWVCEYVCMCGVSLNFHTFAISHVSTCEYVCPFHTKHDTRNLGKMADFVRSGSSREASSSCGCAHVTRRGGRACFFNFFYTFDNSHEVFVWYIS